MFNINKRPNNKRLIEKAAMMLSDLSTGGLLQAEQSSNFVRGIIEESALLNMCDAFSMSRPSKKIDKLTIDDHVLRGDGASFTTGSKEANPLLAAEQTVPSTSSVELTTNEFVGEIQISYDALEDNIEEGGLRNTLQTMLLQAATRDCEEIVLMSSNTPTGSTGDDFTAANVAGGTIANDPLNVIEGLIQNIAHQSVTLETGTDADGQGHGGFLGSHSVSAGDFGTTNWYDDVSLDLLASLRGLIPSKYIRNPNDFVFLTNHMMDMKIRRLLVDRTTGLGDSMLQGFDANVLYGSRVVPIPMWATYNNQTDNGATDPIAENTWVAYMNPKNLAVGFHRDITIETDRDISARKFIIVLTLRFGWVIKEYDAVGILENVLV